MKPVGKNMKEYYSKTPYGLQTNGFQWLQKLVAKKAGKLPYDFSNKAEWEQFKCTMRYKIPTVCGIPSFPPMKEAFIRSRSRLGEDVVVERVDIYVDDDYSIPSFVFYGEKYENTKMPAILMCQGWTGDKWHVDYQKFAARMAKQGIMALIFDHIPDGETGFIGMDVMRKSTLATYLCAVLGISQFTLRVAEAMRAGEYLRNRADVDASRVGITGVCQGGMDTWFTAALDDGFCCAAPILSASTYGIHMTEMASYRNNADSTPFPFGILDVCDVEHLHGAIAPRPLLVRGNLPDNWWPTSGFDSIEAFCDKIYGFYDAKDKIDFRFEINEHNITNQFVEALDKFFNKYLLGDQ